MIEKMDGMSQVRVLDLIADLEGILEEKKKGEEVKVTKYASVTRRYHCQCCQFTWDREHLFKKGEPVTVVEKDGKVRTIRIRTLPTTLHLVSWCSTCHQCKDRIRRWPREKLEATLLTHATLRSKTRRERREEERIWV